MPAWVYLSLELSTLVLFGLTAVHAQRRSRAALLELLTAAVYGLLLEWCDIVIYGTYSYSTGFFLRVGPVPITIGLCWALLIYGAMLYSDQLGLPVWSAPFADAIWVIVLDLSFDAVAIRLGFWHWHIALSDGYWGVPAGNFNAWLYVALGFSLVTRWARGRKTMRSVWQLLAPLLAFLILLGGITLFDGLVRLLYPHTLGDKGMLIFAATLALFAGVTGVATLRYGLHLERGLDVLPTLTRWLMHGYFGLWLVVWLLVPQTRLAGMDLPPFLIGVAFALLVVEASLVVLVLLRHGRWIGHRQQLPRAEITVPVADRVSQIKP
ncbi:MAG: carotenoid biosynthesis protein [Herpetosiphonaceae bacterium]|nr:carotenoid biosynthesis protein [Herpetosiphonaceae bacterium]